MADSLDCQGQTAYGLVRISNPSLPRGKENKCLLGKETMQTESPRSFIARGLDVSINIEV